MDYENDIERERMREEARKRLEARMARRNAGGSDRYSRARNDSGARSSPATRTPAYAGPRPNLAGATILGFPLPLVLAAIVVVLLIILLVSGIRGCVSGKDAADTTGTQVPSTPTQTQDQEQSTGAGGSAGSSGTSSSGVNAPVSSSPASPFATDGLISTLRSGVEGATIDEIALSYVLGNDLASQLLAQAETNPDARWIAAHPEEYLEDGSIVQYKMLRLAAREPQSIPFVRDWPQKYCADEPDYNESHTDESSNGVPRLYQWDKRWGYTEYSSTTFALTGCAPTSMAMVYQARTGDTSMSPYDIAVYAINNGYATAFNGTDGSLFTYGAAGLGLNGMQIDTAGYAITQALQSGYLVVANVGPGDFTDSGHYFVVTGLNGDGTVTINDPFSAVRSSMNWDPAVIAGQSMAIYAIA